MKTYLQIFVPLLTLLAVSSCNDFLNKDLLGKETSDTFFTSDDNAQAAVTAVYDKLYTGGSQPDWWWSSEAWDLYMGDMCSDDAEKGSTEADFSSLTHMENWDIPAGESIIRSLWSNNFVGIARANFVLDNIDNSVNVSDNYKKQYKGEALFLKGWYYFFLLRHFGPVPIFETGCQPSDFGKVPRGTFHATFEQIASDFTQAIDLLPERSEYTSADMGRATKGAARAFLARLYMYEIGVDPECAVTWQDVYDQTSAIIKSSEYSLVPNYATIEEPEGENNSESVFEVQFTECQATSTAKDVGTGWARFQQNRNTNNVVQGWGFNNPTQNLVDEYDFTNTGDPRLTCTVYGADFNNGILYGTAQSYDRASQGTDYFSRKAAEEYAPTYDGSTGGHNIRLMRYADVLLMHAEACYYLSKPDEAKTYLNKVRERARQSTYCKGYTLNQPDAYTSASNVNLPDVTSTGDDLLNAIWHERRVEFAMEGNRTWDLIRQGRYISVVNNVKCDTRTSTNTTDGEMKFSNFKVNCTSHTLTGLNDNLVPVLPILSSEVSSWNLEQNPGY
jgi:starch-binding outer membrane protein, SusD/RagB family